MIKQIVDILATVWAWIFIASITILVTGPIAFCSVVLAPFDPQRRLAHAIGVFWGCAIIRANPNWKLHLSGTENIDPRGCYVIISNHSSLSDIISLFNLRMQFKWMAKKSLFYIPFLGWSMWFQKYIALERGKHGSIRESYDKALEWLKDGMSVLIFPEGTRSRDGRLGDFKNGAFKLAIQSGRPILPIALAGTHAAIKKGTFMIGSTVEAHLTVLPPVEVTDYKSGDFEKLKVKVRTLIQAELAKGSSALSA